MKSDLENYKDGMSYEIFMRRAFRSHDNSKKGMHCSIIQNLVRVEQGDNSFVRWHGSFTRQFEDAKKYMHSAMDKFLKMKLIPVENLERLTILKSKIDRSANSRDLLIIIEEATELTQSVKDY